MMTVSVDKPNGPTVCVWKNAQYRKVLGDTPLAAVVDPVTYAALEGWVEANIETRNDNSRVSRDSSQFTLDVQGSSLKFVKTRHDKHPPGTTLWIVTATHLTERANQAEPEVPVHSTAIRPVFDTSIRESPLAVMTPGVDPMASIRLSFDPSSDPTKCENLLESTDWARTPLGPREKWSPEIASMVNLTMISVTPHAVWVGPELIGI